MLVHHLQIKVRIVLFLISLFEFYLPGIRQIDLIQFYLEISLHAMDVIYFLFILSSKVVNYPYPVITVSFFRKMDFILFLK